MFHNICIIKIIFSDHNVIHLAIIFKDNPNFPHIFNTEKKFSKRIYGSKKKWEYNGSFNDDSQIHFSISLIVVKIIFDCY